jgi:TatD DNase family protein
MNNPLPGDFIDIHTHGSGLKSGICAIENLMAHEERKPGDLAGQPCTYGIHPWHLDRESVKSLIVNVESVSSADNLIAIGEAGFDKLRGAVKEIQLLAFEAQVRISEETNKPLFIHCVRAWDELLPVHKRVRPKMPWMIHGFRGNTELAAQLVSKGMYLSFWFEFVLRPESSKLLKSLPVERIFLETDGAEVGISTIYEKVAADLNMEVLDLKSVILNNYYAVFPVNSP